MTKKQHPYNRGLSLLREIRYFEYMKSLCDINECVHERQQFIDDIWEEFESIVRSGSPLNWNIGRTDVLVKEIQSFGDVDTYATGLWFMKWRTSEDVRRRAKRQYAGRYMCMKDIPF